MRKLKYFCAKPTCAEPLDSIFGLFLYLLTLVLILFLILTLNLTLILTLTLTLTLILTPNVNLNPNRYDRSCFDCALNRTFHRNP